MPDHKKIYKTQAGKYDLLVSREDYQKNLFPALNQVRPLDGLDVVEFGAGTGRLTCMMAPIVKSILAFDASQHMLGVATTKLEKAGLENWKVAVADNRSLPVGDQIADIAISGWSICYLFAWEEERWWDELADRVASEGLVILSECTGIWWLTR